MQMPFVNLSTTIDVVKLTMFQAHEGDKYIHIAGFYNELEIKATKENIQLLKDWLDIALLYL